MIEETILIIKPDIIKKKYIGKILNILERKNIQIKYLKMIKLDYNTAREFYLEHEKKNFFNELINFIISEKIVILILEGNNIINKIRNLIGNTDLTKAKKNTIRKKFATNLTENAVHASDSKNSFLKEKKILFEFIKKTQYE